MRPCGKNLPLDRPLAKPQAAAKPRWRRVWLRVHRYLGLSLGLWLVLAGLTGASNVFYKELELGLDRRLQVAPLGRTPLPLASVLDRLHAAHPRRRGTWTLYPIQTPEQPLRAIYPKPEESADAFFRPLIVFVDPYTGAILKQVYWAETPYTWIYELHASLTFGKTGFKLVSTLGLIVVVSLSTGLYLWWPRGAFSRKLFVFKPKPSGVRFNADLHRLVGFYGGTVLLLIALSGASFGYTKELTWLVRRFSEVADLPSPVHSVPRPGAVPLDADRAVAIALRRFPKGRISHVQTPDGAEGVYVVRLRQPRETHGLFYPSTVVWIDPYGGEVLHVRDPRRFTAGETLLDLMWPLHNGEVGGLPGRIVVCGTGLLPLVLYLTGFRHWRAKRRAARHQTMRGE